MGKKFEATTSGIGKTRREFLSAAIKGGFTLTAAMYISEGAFAREKKAYSGNQFDYIVVGGGSSGTIIAYRLAAAGFKTLLVEAGSSDINQRKISEWKYWTENGQSNTDWDLPIASQEELNGLEMRAQAGKILGGSGSINAMFWLKPDIRDISKLCKSLGGTPTSKFYEKFNELECFVTNNSRNRSTTGRLKVGRYATDNPLSEASLAAGASCGIAYADLNSVPYIDGCGYADVNIDLNGKRSGPAQTYLADAIKLDSFDVVTDTLATKLLLYKDKCQGIECNFKNKNYRVYARREVIVCSGAMGSPKLLMLSGIGNKADLKSVGIQTYLNLPKVGYQLQDHVYLNGLAFTGGPSYRDNITYGRIASHYFASSDTAIEPPNIQLMCMQQPFPADVMDSEHGFSILPWVAKVKSRGHFKLLSNNPAQKGLLDPQYLGDKRDMEVMLDSLDIALNIGRSSELKEFIDAQIYNEKELISKQQKIDFIRKNVLAGTHFTGTCMMGTDSQNSVVDKNFLVHNFRNLRVADASVLPEVPGVNPHVTIMAMAEIASERIIP